MKKCIKALAILLWCLGLPGAVFAAKPRVIVLTIAQGVLVLGYVCVWHTPAGSSVGSWKCGCQNESCALPAWQLQIFKQIGATGTTGGTTGTTGTGTTGGAIEGVPNLILDTDFSPDTDDVGALAVLHALADRREVNILGVVTSMSDPYAIGAVDVVNTYYGRPDVPLGAYMGDFMANVPCSDSTWCPYAAKLTREFPSDIKRRDQVPDAVKAYRKIMSEQPDNSVTIATIGFLSNLDALLKSGPDEFSSLNGKELIRQKVKLLVIGGSDYPTGRTYNLSHRGAGTWAQYVVHNWPGRITFCLNAVGGPIMTGSGLKNPSSNPVKRAYDIWLAPPRPSGPNRPSWDQAVVLYAVRGPASPLWEEVGPYENVFGSDGSSRFQSQGSGNDYYVRKTQPDAELKRLIEELMEAPPRN